MHLARVAALLAAVGCSGGGSGSSLHPAGKFLVVGTEPANNGRLYLNESIAIDFSHAVDLATANLNTVSFQVFDAAGNPLSEQPAGTFQVTRSPANAAVGRRLEFVPAFPTNNTYTNGGFKPGRSYLVQLVGGSGRNHNVLTDVGGQGLSVPISFQLTTANGSTPAELFEDTAAGGPRRTGFSVGPIDAATNRVALSKLGEPAVQVELTFNQALNPNSANVPVNLDPDPTIRPIAATQRIRLEYDDPETGVTAIPASVDLTTNTSNGAVVTLIPFGVLPNDADVRVIVENTLEDISGESNVNDPSYDRVFATFRTLQAYEPQFDAVVESFDSTRQLDLDAAFLEPPAEIHAGYVRAGFDFNGSSTVLDYEPNQPNVVLDTDFTQITPKGATPINVSGGVFQFRNVTIHQGVTVHGVGTHPMVWQCSGDFVVDGNLDVNGGDGAVVTSFASANVPTGGGVGACGGGNGGRGSPGTTMLSPTGEAGNGPGQVRGAGGQGGRRAVGTAGAGACARGSGGGGGSMSTQGDPHYKVKQGAGTSFVEVAGQGGYGCAGPSGAGTRTLGGGNAGPLVFADARADNDFWGAGVDLRRQIRIAGELPMPIGGAGGGGGGDQSATGNPSSWIGDAKGGGGGGGSGVLVIEALGTIHIGSLGRISANGGNGGGGQSLGGNTLGGGGGGGSGGMVVLIAGGGIEFETHDETYANNNYVFSVAAEGGVGLQSQFAGTRIPGKYPPPPTGALWDANPAGGFGGMGLVELMAPSGTNSDGTNTVLDDNIHVISNGTSLTGDDKERYLAWRGFWSPTGTWVGDDGMPTYNNPKTTPGYPAWATDTDSEGDVRPAPVLLPGPISHLSRVRSKWIDTGATVRRPVASTTQGPRGIIENPANNLLAGPRYEFATTQLDPSDPENEGYIAYRQTPAGIAIDDQPVPSTKTSVQSIEPNDTFLGAPAYRLDLATPAMGAVADRYADYRIRLTDAGGALLSEHRILGHSDRTVWLDTESPLPGTSAGLQSEVVAKFFDVQTDSAPGLGPTHPEMIHGSLQNVPAANIRFGFAFHKDATQAKASGIDTNRMPPQVGTFLYDLADPAVQEQIRTFMGSGTGAAFVQWDALFNISYSQVDPTQPAPGAPISPSSPRPELRYLVVPYRF